MPGIVLKVETVQDFLYELGTFLSHQIFQFFTVLIAPSSSKFNPKRHQLSMAFPYVFRFLSSEPQKHKEKSLKVVFLD